MRYIQNSDPDELLKNIPDFFSWEKADIWLQDEIHTTKQIPLEWLENAEFTSLEWHPPTENKSSFFNLYTSEKWRKFVLATFSADLVSYIQAVDRVNFERLLFVMHAYPQGFRTWWIKLPDQQWHPIGYTGWYPMLETAFEQFEAKPETLKDRLVAPNVSSNNPNPYLYLFNYSVIPLLKKTPLTKQLMTELAKEITHQNAAGLACITVSSEGIRIAKRFKMSLAGSLCYEGDTEEVYTVRY